MRELYLSILKTYFHEKLIHLRSALGLTQEQMADLLRMNCRNYVYLDHGKNCCSALTLVLFLLYVCDDPVAFLEELRRKFDSIDNNLK